MKAEEGKAMKKKILRILVLAMAFTLLTGCGNDKASDSSGKQETKSASRADSDGLYTWTLTNGYTLRTKTDIMRYIDGDVFRVTALAKDLGFRNRTEQKETDVPTGFLKDFGDDTLYVTFDSEDDRYLNVMFHFFGSEARRNEYDTVVKHYRHEKYIENTLYKFNRADAGKKMDFDLIVCFTYGCEHYAAGETCVFDGLLPMYMVNSYNLNLK